MSTQIQCPADKSSGDPLTPRLLKEMLSPLPAGEVATPLIGKVQVGALNSRIRNDGKVRVRLGGSTYQLMPHPDNAQQFLLACESFTKSGLSWGYAAFSSAIEDGIICYV